MAVKDPELEALEALLFSTLRELGYAKRGLSCWLELERVGWVVSVERIPRIGRRRAVRVGAWWPALEVPRSANDCELSIGLGQLPIAGAGDVFALLALDVEMDAEQRFAELRAVLSEMNDYVRRLVDPADLAAAIVAGGWSHGFVSKVARDELGVVRGEDGWRRVQ